MILDPKLLRHPNEATYDQPNRVSIDTEWTDVLRSRYVLLVTIPILADKIIEKNGLTLSLS